MAEPMLRIAGESEKALPKRIAFTVDALNRVKCPAGKDRIWVYDTRQAGLCLMVTNTGAKSFYMYRKVAGRPQRVRLGGFDISVDQARKLAAKTAGEIAGGSDPMAQKHEARAKTMNKGELWDWFLENHAKPRKRSWKTDKYRWEKHLKSRFEHKRLKDVTRGDVQALMTTIGKDHPTGANRLLALLSVMFSKAKLNGYTGTDPTDGIERYKEGSRERFLGSDELPRFLLALEDAHTLPVWKDYFKLLLLTGARRGNLLSARWEDINLDRKEWRIPDAASKSGYAMTVSLAPDAVTILKARANKSPYVFANKRSKSGHLQEPRKAWEGLLRRAKLKDVRLHDLRRTLGSWMAAGGASLPMIGRHLGHRTPSVTAVYARLQLDPVRAAVNQATAAMMATGKTEAAKQDQKVQ